MHDTSFGDPPDAAAGPPASSAQTEIGIGLVKGFRVRFLGRAEDAFRRADRAQLRLAKIGPTNCVPPFVVWQPNTLAGDEECEHCRVAGVGFAAVATDLRAARGSKE